MDEEEVETWLSLTSWNKEVDVRLDEKRTSDKRGRSA